MLYHLNLGQPTASERTPIRPPFELNVLEKHIEEFLTTHLFELVSEDKLMLIGQERSRQEEADLLALDSKGVLYIFEIKRWGGAEENLLQVMRYGQKFGRYSYGQLEDLAHRHQKLEGSLRSRHKQYFQLEEPIAEEVFNQDQRFVVVTNGVDRATLEAIKYWKEKGIKIDCVTYKLYEIDRSPYIQFDTYDPQFESQGEVTPGIYIVNTNSSYMEDAWTTMVGDGIEGKAAAYYDRKHAVQRIERGSTVYLYHTGQGVIAKGRATAGFRRTDYEGDRDEEYYVPLRFDWALSDSSKWSEAIKPWEINSHMGTGHRFRQTVIEITKEMSEVIDQIWADHQATLEAAPQ
jgi:hypothetical protein